MESKHILEPPRRDPASLPADRGLPAAYTTKPDGWGSGVSVRGDEFQRIVDALADVQRAEGSEYTSFRVRGKRFGYYWPRTQTVGLKQTLSEQRALIAERPDVFEEQFT